MKRAFICWVPALGTLPDSEECGVYLAETASKARYRCFLAAKDAGFAVMMPEVQVRRAPAFDGMLERDSGKMRQYVEIEGGPEE